MDGDTSDDDGEHATFLILDADGGVIAELLGPAFDFHAVEKTKAEPGFIEALEEAKATSDLFAASPGLYSALDSLVDCWERGSDGQVFAGLLVAARAALAKARGEQ